MLCREFVWAWNHHQTNNTRARTNETDYTVLERQLVTTASQITTLTPCVFLDTTFPLPSKAASAEPKR